jgi:hypothetical protein
MKKEVRSIYFENTKNGSNKFYEMIEKNGKINCRYGKIGKKVSKAKYPISKWNTIYKDKINKGYKIV